MKFLIFSESGKFEVEAEGFVSAAEEATSMSDSVCAIILASEEYVK